MNNKGIKEDILNLHKEGKTNLQIKELTGFNLRTILWAINSSGLKSNRYCWEELSHKADEFVLGSLLGDGSFDKYGRLCFGHCEKQEEYLKFKQKLLVDEKIDVCKLSAYTVDGSRYKTPCKVVTLKTKRRLEFELIRKIYYVNNRKIVPNKEYLLEYLTPFSLSIWFMDDGNAASRHNLQLNTQSFFKESVNILREVLMEKFNVDSTIDGRNVITIRSKSYDLFISLIDSYMLNSMKYKYKLRKEIK